MVLSLAVPVMADPSDNTTVGTTATVGGTAPPYICAKFETPDHSTANGTQILPVAGADRVVKFYVVAGHPNGDTSNIVRVDVTVKYSDTSAEKFQLTALKDMASGNWTAKDNTGAPVPVRLVPWSDTADEIDLNGDCSPDEDITTAMTSLDSQGRIAYGFDGAGNPYKLSGVLFDLKQGKQIMLEFVGKMNCHQPSMDYIVETLATDKIGSTGAKTINRFFYMSIVALSVDFSPGLSFGNIVAGQSNRLLGDNDPATTNRPSVKNEGNDMGKISLKYSKMVNSEGKFIEDFDGRLGSSPYWTLMKANVDTVLKNAAAGPATQLPPCTWTQLDFSVDPPVGTMGGAYTGTVTVTILHY
jgi:hypothetical protein